PFVGPGEKDGAGESAFHHALDVPAEHFRLLALGVADRIHPKLPQDERAIFRKILQAQQVALKVALTVEVDVEAGEVTVLREEKLRGRIAGVGEKHVRIGLTADSNQVLDKFSHAPDAEPAHHRARDLVADEITENGGVTAMRRDR